MAENSKIEWTDHTANLWWGCEKVHQGCKNCYALSLDNRYHNETPHWGPGSFRLAVKSSEKDLNKFQRHAAKENTIKRVFVGSMMDIFEDPLPMVDKENKKIGNLTTGDARSRFFLGIDQGIWPNLMFLLLTKRPENIIKYVPDAWLTNPPKNVAIGYSVADQSNVKNIDHLVKWPGKRFLSVEPLLTQVDLRDVLFTPGDCETCEGNGSIPANGKATFDEGGGGVTCPSCNYDLRLNSGKSPIDWIIVGGESGTGARPMQSYWAVMLKDQARAAKIPFFFKQLSSNGNPEYKDFDKFPNELKIRQHFNYEII